MFRGKLIPPAEASALNKQTSQIIARTLHYLPTQKVW